jgi:Flp pilus assembly protein TadG
LNTPAAFSSRIARTHVKPRMSKQGRRIANVEQPKSLRKLLRRMRRRGTSGSAALQFAMVAPVFFTLLLGVFQAGIIFFAQQTLQNAVMDTGRLIRTGQDKCFSLNNGACVPMNGQDFFNTICNKVSALMACTSTSNGSTSSLIQYDVQNYQAFGGNMNASPLDANGNLPPMNNFQPGNSCDVVMVRVFYKWPIQAPGLDWFLVDMADHGHLLAAATAFRSEPYTTNNGGC